MRYLVGKVKKSYGGLGLFEALSSTNSSVIEFLDNKFYSTIEDAEASLVTYKDKLNKKADEDWEALSDLAMEDMDKKFDEGYIYEKETFIIVPVESVIDVTSLPKHRREIKKEEK